MPVKIRLRRIGAKGHALYRVVVADSRSPRDGRFIETIGHYDPHQDPPEVKFNVERAKHWVAVGAEPTDTARALLKRGGILGGETPAAAE